MALIQPNTKFVGRYRILGKLGEGGWGCVYAVEDEQLNRLSALKVLLPEEAMDDEGRQRFLREAKILANLDHPGIVKILAFGIEETGLPYFVMPMLSQSSLADTIRRSLRMEIDEVLNIGIEVCGLLQYIHEREIVHRDLKPSNLLLKEDGSVALIDFGLSRTRHSQAITEQGLAVGSVLYMSPEMAKGESVGSAADIYGLGCVLYECATGRPPFLGENGMVVLQKQVFAQPCAVNEIVDDPRAVALDQVLQKALAKVPENRFHTAQQFAEALSAVRDSISSTSSGSAIRPHSANFLRLTPVHFVAVIFITIVFGAIGYLLGLHSPREIPEAPSPSTVLSQCQQALSSGKIPPEALLERLEQTPTALPEQEHKIAQCYEQLNKLAPSERWTSARFYHLSRAIWLSHAAKRTEPELSILRNLCGEEIAADSARYELQAAGSQSSTNALIESYKSHINRLCAEPSPANLLKAQSWCRSLVTLYTLANDAPGAARARRQLEEIQSKLLR